MKHTIYGIAFVALLAMAATALAGQTCNVNIACAFFAPGIPSGPIGTIYGNPSGVLTVDYIYGTSVHFTETATACTPGGPLALATLSGASDYLYFVKTTTGLLANFSYGGGNGVVPILCQNK